MDASLTTYTPQRILSLRPVVPTPEPKGPWVMFQQWGHPLFLHWSMPMADVRPLVDSRLDIDTYDGMAWITLVAMQMENLHLRDLPPIPYTGTFPELNLRTYVRYKGNAGVFFISIDAMSELGSWAAGVFFHLPYVYAHMHFSNSNGAYALKSVRAADARYRAAEFDVSYRPTGNLFRPEPGSREYFLAERYCSFAPGPDGDLYYGPLKHAPWLLQPVDVHMGRNTVIAASGMRAPESLPMAVYSPGVQSLCWLPSKVDSDS